MPKAVIYNTRLLFYTFILKVFNYVSAGALGAYCDGTYEMLKPRRQARRLLSSKNSKLERRRRGGACASMQI